MHLRPATSSFVAGTLDTNDVDRETGLPVLEERDRFDFESESATTVDLSLGAEWSMTDGAALRIGAYSDRDISPEEVDGEPVSRIDWWGFFLGLGLSDGLLETSYGIAYRYGSGVRAADDVFGPTFDVVAVPYTAHGVLLVLSGDVPTDTTGSRETTDNGKPDDTESPD